MANLIQAPRGTLDVLPGDSAKWQYIEQVIRDTAKNFSFSEVRFPTFEDIRLFKRGVGDTTDVVQKEMYSFKKGDDHEYALRPEGTASTVRMVLQNGLYNEALPLRLYYIISCFRGERPQAGRYREFHQFGAELFGSAAPAADAEVIQLAASVFEALGIDKLRLEINSIGCPTCRKDYHNALREYFRAHEGELCETCRSRLERNPMRILDCKSEICKEIAKDAPKVLDYICDDCRTHFEEVKERLTAAGYRYTVNPSIVRGLDYYSRTVFEFIDEVEGLTTCGGGRYDGLVEQLGGPSLPALGFGMGLERLLLVMESRGCAFPEPDSRSIYIAPMGAEASIKAGSLVKMLRDEGFSAEYDLAGRSIKAQMKYAGKRAFGYTLVIGDNELSEDSAKLKNMKTGEETPVPLGEGFINAVYSATVDDALEEMTKAAEESIGKLPFAEI